MSHRCWTQTRAGEFYQTQFLEDAVFEGITKNHGNVTSPFQKSAGSPDWSSLWNKSLLVMPAKCCFEKDWVIAAVSSSKSWIRTLWLLCLIRSQYLGAPHVSQVVYCRLLLWIEWREKRRYVLGCISNEATFVFSRAEWSKKGSARRQELYKWTMFRVLQPSEMLFSGW